MLRFPNPVDDVVARLVAGGVVVLAVAAAVTGSLSLLVPLAPGFVLRVLFAVSARCSPSAHAVGSTCSSRPPGAIRTG